MSDFVLRMTHNRGKLVEIKLVDEVAGQLMLTELHQNNPDAYSRLYHYQQCRFTAGNFGEFWVLFMNINFQMAMGIGMSMITKELQAYESSN